MMTRSNTLRIGKLFFSRVYRSECKIVQNPGAGERTNFHHVTKNYRRRYIANAGICSEDICSDRGVGTGHEMFLK